MNGRRLFFEFKRLTTKISFDFTDSQKSYFNLFNFAGYIFLAITIVDYAFIIYPPDFFNAQWEFQALQRIVETGWSPILAGIFLFYPSKREFLKIEKIILSWLSRLFLLLGILYFLSVPLIFADAQRLNNDRNVELAKNSEQQTLRLKQAEKQINSANKQQLVSLISRNPQLKIDLNQSESELRKQILYQNKQRLEYAINQDKSQIEKQNFALRKTSVKLAFNAVLVGMLLIGIFNYSFWIRR